jgi:hypothetical protein
LKREFFFHTRAAGDKDEAIGTRLIDQFGLQPPTGEKLAGSSDFYFGEDEIIDWIAEFVCEHRNPDGSFFPGPVWRSDISLTGGQGGETFRGFYTPPIATRKGFDLASLQLSVDDVVRATADASDLSTQGRDILRRQTAASMPDFPNERLTRVDLLYPLYRNRYHFGFSVRARNLTAPSYIVLYAPSLLLASMCVPERDRACGRVSFDFISRAFPNLLFIPGTYDPWPKQFLDRLAPAPAESQWQQSPTSPRPRTPDGLARSKPLMTRAEAHKRIMARAWDSLNWLRDSAALSPFLSSDAIERKLQRADMSGDTKYPLFLAIRASWARRLISRDITSGAS